MSGATDLEAAAADFLWDLDASRIARALGELGSEIGRPLSVVEVTGSTNDDAKRAAAAGAPHGALFVADSQSSGRGRGAHVWHSPPRSNLYLSLVLRPTLPAVALAPITLAFGVAVARLCASRVSIAPAIKWPNDVYLGEAKMAGVLVEAQLRGDVPSSMVVGVGLNVAAQRFPPDLAGRATSLAAEGATDVDRSRLAAELSVALASAAAAFARDGLVTFAHELEAWDWLRGREVGVGDLYGVAEGIDREGRLLVRSGPDLHSVVAGEVSAGRIAIV